MDDLAARLEAATWFPKARRDAALRVIVAAGSQERALLSFAVGTGQPESVGFALSLFSTLSRRDPQRRLTDDLLRHAVTVAGARSVSPSALSRAIDAILKADERGLQQARDALLALGSGVSLANAHGIYVSAARKAEKTAWPARPPHLGGPVPELSVLETVEVALTLARTLQAKAPHAEAPPLIALAERQLAWERGGQQGQPPTSREDEPKSVTSKGPTYALARAALMEARNVHHVSGRGTSIKSGVVRGLELGEHAWWLAQVDEAVMLADARTAWERKGQATSSPIAHLVWRGGDKAARLWLARLASGSYALLAKLGRSWANSEGDLDAVVGTIPDAWLAKAAPFIEARQAG